MLPEFARTYWQYEYDVAARHMIPLLERWGVTMGGCSVLDVGCGEGGGLAAMADRGAQCAGFDLEAHRIELARELLAPRHIRLATGNLFDDPPFADERFRLLVLHDVIEHLERKEDALRILAGFLAPGGKILITFPPYYSAYGAHQQFLSTWYARIPFFHLLPFSLTHIVPNLRKEHAVFREEVEKLGRLKMGMSAFEQTVARAGLPVERKRAYLLSPNFLRFGIPALPAGPLGSIPALRELICTGVVYLLSRPPALPA
jgi:SAM-dependent methyltransferase